MAVYVGEQKVNMKAAIGDYVLNSEKGAANGVATLDANSKVPVAQLPAKNNVVSATLLAANWVGTEEPFTYTLTVQGVTATSTQQITNDPAITSEQLAALSAISCYDGGQSANTIIIKALGAKPEVNIPIRVVLQGE